MTIGYQKVSITIAGDGLVMHNGQTSDPLNRFSKGIKAINSKRGKTDADQEALARLEFEAGLYVDSEQRVIVPSRVLEAAICEGARKSKEGKLALSGLFVDTDMVLAYEGGPLTVDELRASDAHALRVSVRVGQARVMRNRPYFRNWSGTFQVSLNSEVANPAALKQWITACGAFVGLLDWRPRHGRFAITAFDLV